MFAAMVFNLLFITVATKIFTHNQGYAPKFICEKYGSLNL